MVVYRLQVITEEETPRSIIREVSKAQQPFNGCDFLDIARVRSGVDRSKQIALRVSLKALVKHVCNLHPLVHRRRLQLHQHQEEARASGNEQHPG
ncbi:MAG: hypothetical protein OXD43_08855 [Bacteroidetes bacterium]|nr:hypothetical protein [Bacteroidota bacterium]